MRGKVPSILPGYEKRISMTFPIFRFIEINLPQKGSEEVRDDLFVSTLVVDLVLFITTLVLSILGVFSVIGMPPAASYSLIGVNAGIVLLYIALIIRLCYCSTMPEHPATVKSL